MTIEEQIADEKAYLEALTTARNDLVSAGLPVRFEVGNRIVTYTKLENINKEIRRVKSAIIILEREIY